MAILFEVARGRGREAAGPKGSALLAATRVETGWACIGVRRFFWMVGFGRTLSGNAAFMAFPVSGLAVVEAGRRMDCATERRKVLEAGRRRVLEAGRRKVLEAGRAIIFKIGR